MGKLWIPRFTSWEALNLRIKFFLNSKNLQKEGNLQKGSVKNERKWCGRKIWHFAWSVLFWNDSNWVPETVKHDYPLFTCFYSSSFKPITNGIWEKLDWNLCFYSFKGFLLKRQANQKLAKLKGTTHKIVFRLVLRPDW